MQYIIEYHRKQVFQICLCLSSVHLKITTNYSLMLRKLLRIKYEFKYFFKKNDDEMKIA